MASEEDFADAIECYFPYDGPHSHESVIDAARGAVALVRYLNNATGGVNRVRTLEWVATSYRVIAGVHALVTGLDQLLKQLAVAMELQNCGSLYDDRTDRAAADTAYEVLGGLEEARYCNDVLRAALATVCETASHLGNN